MIGWRNAGYPDPMNPGWQYWLPLNADALVMTHCSVSGSGDRWRYWHVNDPPGGGKIFGSKAAAIAAAEARR